MSPIRLKTGPLSVSSARIVGQIRWRYLHNTDREHDVDTDFLFSANLQEPKSSYWDQEDDDVGEAIENATNVEKNW